MPLPVDYKIDKIIKEIHKMLLDKGKEVSYETILRCLNQQVDSTIAGIERGDTIVWKYFGTFVATKRRVEGLNKTYAKRGIAPKLQDTGLTRISFNMKGEFVSEGKFEPKRKEDTLDL